MNAILIEMGNYQGGIAELALRDYFAVILLISGIALIVVAACLILRAPETEAYEQVELRSRK